MLNMNVYRPGSPSNYDRMHKPVKQQMAEMVLFLDTYLTTVDIARHIMAARYVRVIADR